MRFVNVYPGSASRNHFFPTNVNRTEQAAVTKCAPKTTAKNRPAVNIIEREDDFRIELAAPGFGKDHFQLNVENQVLTIAGKKEVLDEAKERRNFRGEDLAAKKAELDEIIAETQAQEEKLVKKSTRETYP